MAKCIGPTTNWTASEEVSFFVGDVKHGENLISKKLEETNDLIFDIANDCNLVQVSAHRRTDLLEGDKWDCNQIRDSLVTKLNKLGSEVSSGTQKLITSDLIASTKHRYFILFSCGIIEKLKQLLQVVGRLSDLDQKLYLEEQNKPLVSEESIAIHSLTTVWLAVISIMHDLIEPGRKIFKDQLESNEYSFLEQLEFSTAGLKHARIFLMDLIITSWIQFNRLVKYEDLTSKLPFLCPCHCKTYLVTLETIFKSDINQNYLTQILPLMIDYQSKPSLLTQTTRQYEIVPPEPFFKDSDQASLAYFVIWHLYSVYRIIADSNKHFITDCDQLIEDSFEITMKQFIPMSQQSVVHLSPHQEERFKLIFVMLSSLCEKNPRRLTLMKLMFSFFNNYWAQFGENYFDNSRFRIERLTIFQLFTKMLDDAQLLYDKEGQAISNEDRQSSREEKEIEALWSRLLARTKPPPVVSK